MRLIPTTNRRLFISWVPHARRSSAIAEAIGAEAIFIYYFNRKSLLHALVRYFLSFFKTWFILLSQRPQVVFCINQPIFCVWTCFLYGWLSGAFIALDHHAGAFNMSATVWARPFLKYAVKHVALNLMPNPEHKPLLESWGGTVKELGTIPFNFRNVKSKRTEQEYIVCISTFSADEPIELMVDVAREMSALHFYITGNTNYADFSLLNSAPNNLTFTGFLPDNDYVSLLAGAKAIMCLTTRDNTLQRGAYEAMSLSIPVITSDWGVLREAFPQGTVFVKNSLQKVIDGITYAFTHHDQLTKDMSNLLISRQEHWQQACHSLNAYIAQWFTESTNKK